MGKIYRLVWAWVELQQLKETWFYHKDEKEKRKNKERKISKWKKRAERKDTVWEGKKEEKHWKRKGAGAVRLAKVRATIRKKLQWEKENHQKHPEKE